MDWMLKSMSIHQMDNKGIVKSNFVTSCIAFRGSIPIVPSLTKFVNSHSNISLFIFHRKILILYLAIYANEIILISNNEHLLAKFFSNFLIDSPLRILLYWHTSYVLRYFPLNGLLLSQQKYIVDFLTKAKIANSKEAYTSLLLN